MSGSNAEQFLERLKRKQDEPAPQGWRAWGPKAGVAAVLTTLAVALFVPVESTITASGQIVPSARTKTVQHLEGGIVGEVLVKEGQQVKAGDELLRIDLGAAGLNLEEITAKVAALRAAQLRLTAESTGATLSASAFPEDIPPEVRDAELQAYRARLLEQDGQEMAARAQVQIHASRGQEVQAKIEGLKIRVEILKSEYELTAQLAREKLVAELEALQLRKEYETARAELSSTRQGLLSAQAAADEARGKLAEAAGRFRRRAAEELLTTERNLSTASEDLRRARSQRERTSITAPATGIVKGLRSGQPGWVVKPGEQVLEIVPTDALIEVEARLKPADRGLVTVGMPVKIKVSAYDFLRYGALEGKVLRIAADADKAPESQESYFKMVVETEGTALGKSKQPVTPGMQADVDVIIGHQPFIWFLLRPVLKVSAEAFREP